VLAAKTKEPAFSGGLSVNLLFWIGAEEGT